MSLKRLEEKSAKKRPIQLEQRSKSIPPMQNKVNQHPFTENITIQNRFEISKRNSGRIQTELRSEFLKKSLVICYYQLDKLISVRCNQKKKECDCRNDFTPLCPLYRRINFLNLLRSGTKLELSTLYIFFLQVNLFQRSYFFHQFQKMSEK